MGMNSRDLHGLGPQAQAQALQKLGARQRQREKKTGKGNKYGAKKADVLLPDGSVKRFASEKEAARFRELDLLQRAGKISRLECQAPFVLLPHQKREDGKAEQPVKYIADFVYWENGRKVVEDVKGYTDTGSAAYKLYTVKRKLMLHVHGITIREI